MNMLDNEAVSVGDSVFDIINGYGQVLESTSTILTVRFGNNRKMTFSTTGYYNGTRRLFWHNPIILAPEKNEKSWIALVSAIAGLTNYIKSKQNLG